jgi:hypothetical protein
MMAAPSRNLDTSTHPALQPGHVSPPLISPNPVSGNTILVPMRPKATSTTEIASSSPAPFPPGYGCPTNHTPIPVDFSAHTQLVQLTKEFDQATTTRKPLYFRGKLVLSYRDTTDGSLRFSVPTSHGEEHPIAHGHSRPSTIPVSSAPDSSTPDSSTPDPSTPVSSAPIVDGGHPYGHGHYGVGDTLSLRRMVEAQGDGSWINSESNSSGPDPHANGPIRRRTQSHGKWIKSEPKPTGSDPSTNDPAQAPEEPAPPKIRTTEEQLEDLMETLPLRVSNEFLPINDPDGDTLVYIGPPARLARHTSDDHERIKAHFHRFHIVKSSDFKALGSKKFGADTRQFLGPGCSIRAQKRFKKLEIYQKLDSSVLSRIRFYVDLRPPSEDDDAVVLLTSLTCTTGVRKWFEAKEKYTIPNEVIGGTDELDTPSNPYHFNISPEASVEVDQPKKTLLVPELCALRQHSAVERMLNAICGKDPKLDSAPKVWAFFATANFYDCAKHPIVNKWIEKWLYYGNNANFIQSNPEVVYRMALGCQNEHMVKDSFAILVGEKALLDVQSFLNQTVSSTTHTVHGRPLEVLDDDERNRIDHAASSLISRIRELYKSVVMEIDWSDDSIEFVRLQSCLSNGPKVVALCHAAITAISKYCTARLMATMSAELCLRFGDYHDPSGWQDMRFASGSMLSLEEVYSSLPVEARPYTRSFWIALSKTNFAFGDIDIEHNVDGLRPVENRASNVVKSTLQQAITKLNDALYEESVRNNDKTGNTEFMRQAYRMATVPSPSNDPGSTKRTGQGSGSTAPTSPGKRRKLSSFAEAVKSGLPGIGSSGKDAISDLKMPVDAPMLDAATGVPSTTSAGPSSRKDDTNADGQAGGRVPTSGLGAPGRSAYREDVDDHGLPVYRSNEYSAIDDGIFAFEGTSDPSAPPPPIQDQASDAASMNVLTGDEDWTEIGRSKGKGKSRADYDDQRAHPRGKVKQQFSDTEPTSDWWEINGNQNLSYSSRPAYFRTEHLLTNMSRALDNKCQEMIYPAHLFHSSDATPVNLVDTLICLDDDEWKYLPLWAGGLDDGKGGVFDEVDVPNDDAAGFRGGKRGIGKDVGMMGTSSVSGTDSSFDDIADEAISTVGQASKDATDGTRTVRSINSDVDAQSDYGTMSHWQEDVYKLVQEMKVKNLATTDNAKGKTKWTPAEDVDFDEDFVGGELDDFGDDDSTTKGAGSDVQGEFFGGDGNDELMNDDDSDMEIIDKDEFVRSTAGRA